MSRGEIAALLGDVFEHAPEVGEAIAGQAPFASVTALHAALLGEIDRWPADRVFRFLNNHPDLAAPAQRREPLTPDSAREQAGVGLDRMTPEQAKRLAEWNIKYRARFGFPFIICALRHSRDSIIAEFARRQEGTSSNELRNALTEIGRISALRLARKVTGVGLPRVHGALSTHILDTANGVPAAGIPIELYVLGEGTNELVARTVSNRDGRTDVPLIAGRPVPNGTYELCFDLTSHLASSERKPLLGVVPIRFTTNEPEAHYHIPLLFTPWSYTTYRGS